ncbi:MAG: hypothetical protein AAFY56_02035 [Pseudomonadota bacterium]
MASLAITEWIERLRTGLRHEDVTVVSEEPPPAVEAAGPYLVPRSRAGADPKVLMCLTLGLRGDHYDQVIEIIDAQKRPDLEPLIVTDQADFDQLRLRGLLFEYFPPTESQAKFAPERPWELYLLRRLGRLRQKWAPVRMIAFGTYSQGILARLAASPFEDETIHQVIGAPATDA